MRNRCPWRLRPVGVVLFGIAVCLGASGCGGRLNEGAAPSHPACPGVVVSAHPAATAAGIEMFERGGNAVDAACAVGFALAVVLPEAGNLGGGGFMVLRHPDGEAAAVDFREMAPAAAHRDVYLDPDGNVIPRMSLEGYRAVAVPGTVAGLCLALEKYGSLPLPVVIQPAIRLARDGFVVSSRLEASLQTLKPYLDRFPRIRRFVCKPDGTLPKAGDVWRQPELARTLETIAREGPDAFYRGPIARRLADLFAREGDGWLTLEDLDNYRAVIRKPIRVRYRGYELISMPPPSSGGLCLAQILKILEPFRLREKGAGTAATIQLMVEAERLAYADRAVHLGDPDFVSVPVDRLLSPVYIERRRALIREGRKNDSRSIQAGDPDRLQEGGQTTHYSVLGPDGTAVSTTVTLNTRYGAKVACAGFFLNSEMDDFSAKPGVPNYFGLVGAEANAIQPSKRPLSSMTPTIVVGPDGTVEMVVGSPGGSTIITTVLQVVLNVLEHRMGPRESVDAPRFHHQWLPDCVFAERDRFPPRVIQELERMGYRFDFDRWPTIGEVNAVIRDSRTGRWVGVPDRTRREDGTAAVFEPSAVRAR